MPVSGADCSFSPSTAYVLMATKPAAVVAVDLTSGDSRTLATLSGVDTLDGIAFDRWGRFGHRLLVTGRRAGATSVMALDCSGKTTLVTDSAPLMEGGMEVAPPAFGAFGGELVGPDEGSGAVIAVAPDGVAQLVARTGLAGGKDIGAESLGFVPAGFGGGGAAYLAAGGPLFRLPSSDLLAAGVREGDLLVANAAGATTVAVRCAADGSCSRVATIIQATAGARVEGHLLLAADHPGPQARPLPPGHLGAASRGGLSTALPYAVGIVLLTGLFLLYRRRQRRR
jgi:hypothetical protein